MLLIVSDTSVLIDIEQGELTSAMFSLPCQFIVPDILFASELAERHSHLLQLGLISKTLNGDLVAEAYLLHKKYIRPSVNDMLALTLAKHENCQLLTGDKALREAAIELNVEVHGTIWLVEQMIQNENITVEVASVGFQRMREAGSRLPWVDVEMMLGKGTCQ